MSTLEKLIAQLCPDGVEYKQLGEICDFNNGYTPSKSCSEYWNDGNVPWFRLEDIRVNGRVLTDSIQHITKVAVKGALFPANSLIVSTSATIGEYALVLVPALTNQRFTALSIKSEFASKIDVGFLKHMGYVIGEYCKDNINQGNFASVDMKAFRKFMFPIPPLSVQKEIVRMLDDMAGLIDALEEELAARKKQYEWYRDRLLGMRNSEYCSVTLGEVCEFRNGYTPSKANDKFWNDGDVPWFRMDDIRVNGRILSDAIQHVTNAAVKKSGLVKPNSVVFATTATIGEHALISTEFLTNQQMTSLTVKDETVLVPKFLFYLGFDIGKSCRKIAHVGGGLPIVDSMKFRSLEVSLPPLSEQRRIVKILDNFDTLCNSMTEGLPGEIALRKQQYEFYRDKLLTFKKAV